MCSQGQLYYFKLTLTARSCPEHVHIVSFSSLGRNLNDDIDIVVHSKCRSTIVG